MTYTATQISTDDKNDFILTKTMTATSSDGTTATYQIGNQVNLAQLNTQLSAMQNIVTLQQAKVTDLQAQITAINTCLGGS